MNKSTEVTRRAALDGLRSARFPCVTTWHGRLSKAIDAKSNDRSCRAEQEGFDAEPEVGIADKDKGELPANEGYRCWNRTSEPPA